MASCSCAYNSSHQVSSCPFILVRTNLKQWKISNKISSGRCIGFPFGAWASWAWMQPCQAARRPGSNPDPRPPKSDAWARCLGQAACAPTDCDSAAPVWSSGPAWAKDGAGLQGGARRRRGATATDCAWTVRWAVELRYGAERHNWASITKRSLCTIETGPSWAFRLRQAFRV